MEPRLLPLVTFRCDVCGLQETVRATDFHRRADKPDVIRPRPRHHGVRMEVVQVAYWDEVV